MNPGGLFSGHLGDREGLPISLLSGFMLHDLVVRTFREALIHTPINKLGINRLVHFGVGDEETRDKIGKKLAPQEAWGEWASDIAGTGKNKHGVWFPFL